MLLSYPERHNRFCPDDRPCQTTSEPLVRLEDRGLMEIKQDNCDRAWGADFLEFVEGKRPAATPRSSSGAGPRRRKDHRFVPPMAA